MGYSKHGCNSCHKQNSHYPHPHQPHFSTYPEHATGYGHEVHEPKVCPKITYEPVYKEVTCHKPEYTTVCEYKPVYKTVCTLKPFTKTVCEYKKVVTYPTPPAMESEAETEAESEP